MSRERASVSLEAVTKKPPMQGENQPCSGISEGGANMLSRIQDRKKERSMYAQYVSLTGQHPRTLAHRLENNDAL